MRVHRASIYMISAACDMACDHHKLSIIDKIIINKLLTIKKFI